MNGVHPPCGHIEDPCGRWISGMVPHICDMALQNEGEVVYFCDTDCFIQLNKGNKKISPYSSLFLPLKIIIMTCLDHFKDSFARKRMAK